MLLNIIVGTAVLMSGNSCAAIDNRTNTAVWQTPGQSIVRSGYEDMGRVLVYDKSYPQDTDTLVALIRAEDALQVGPGGPKIRMVCMKDGQGTWERDQTRDR